MDNRRSAEEGTMEPEAFVQALEGLIQTALDAMTETAACGPPGPGVEITDLLRVALRNELEASEEAARWMISEPDVAVKLALARQCGDEARHYRLIEARLRALGAIPLADGPVPGGFSPMYDHLAALSTTAERIAAGPFAREALACLRNEVFAAHCEARGDTETAALYRETIQPDERHHQAAGRALLVRHAVTQADQAAARAAVEGTLALAASMQELAWVKKGVASAPGC